MLKTNKLGKTIYKRNLRLGVTTLLYQSNYEIDLKNLITQAIEVEGLQVQSMYAFFQRSIDRRINNYLQRQLKP